MHLLVGLGNPGRQYAHTRHNIGFMVVDVLAARHQGQFVAGRGEFWYSRIAIGSAEAVLLKPATYMNNSGLAVREAAEYFAAPAAETVIVLDDFQLPLGRLRIRPSGSDGGHRGLESVIYHLGTDQVPRVRCGIGPEMVPAGQDAIIDFVLSVFDDRERSAVETLVLRAADAAETIVTLGVAPAMNRFNAPV